MTKKIYNQHSEFTIAQNGAFRFIVRNCAKQQRNLVRARKRFRARALNRAAQLNKIV